MNSVVCSQSNLVIWKKPWISIQLLKLNFFQMDNLRNLPCCGCLARLSPQCNIEMVLCKWPILRLHILFPDKKTERSASYPTGTLMIECNQYILVILSAGPFLLFASPEVNFPGDLCVIKQYYLFLEPQQGSKLASSAVFCHRGDRL